MFFSKTHTIIDHVKTSFKKYRIPFFVSVGAILLAAVLLFGGGAYYSQQYTDRIYPRISVGGILLGGLTEADALERLESAYSELLDAGITLQFQPEGNGPVHAEVLDLRVSGATDPDLVYDLVYANPDQMVEDAFSIGHDLPFFDRLATAFSLYLKPRQIDAGFEVSEASLRTVILDRFSDFEVEGAATDFAITLDGDKTAVEVVEGAISTRFDLDAFLEVFTKDLQDFSLVVHEIRYQEGSDFVTHEEALVFDEEINDAMLAAPYVLTYEAPDTRLYDWTVDASDLSDWLLPQKNVDGIVALGLAGESYESFLEDIRFDVDDESIDAIFHMEGDRVVEFSGSYDGVAFDEEVTRLALLEHFGQSDVDLAISVQTVAPEVSTDSVNDFGIKEILGVGYSDFSGSPSNRIKNITHGSNKLDGLLIAPDEEVSLVEELKPFTLADGYLPELVIKGDEIKPEVGGGLCQLGTTAFRGVMNSGLNITQRRNHSLVVGYYNDPSNGNPGTDATLYDPNPDFKFVNDTGNYILLETEVDLAHMELVYTFWGTNDGRRGWYSPPVVLSWNGYGETQYTETDSLAPGVERCQSPHSGATTSFDYFVEYKDGELFEKNYTSTYRSLPRICLVGAAAEGGEVGSSDPVEPELVDEDAEELDVSDIAPEEI
jgi:vancomycin resistance protein YoaR